MEEKKIPTKLIDAVIEFIDGNDLGPTKIGIFNEVKKRAYSPIEISRKQKILSICRNFFNKKIDYENLKSSIKNETKINDELSLSLSEKIKKIIEEPVIEEVEKGEENSLQKNQSIEKNKNSIFSKLIE